jgi:hypothetical protein
MWSLRGGRQPRARPEKKREFEALEKIETTGAVQRPSHIGFEACAEENSTKRMIKSQNSIV